MATKKKKDCIFGKKCYRKNAQHRSEFNHPEPEKDITLSPPSKKQKTITECLMPQKVVTDEQEEDKTSVPDGKEDTSSTTDELQEKPTSPTEVDTSSTDELQESDAPPSPTDVAENIKQKFLVAMPKDFYDFWEFAKTIDPKKPSNALLPSLGLQLVGPYDVLAGTACSAGQKICFLTHWRYYYDPPEFLTVLKGDDTTQFHIGYYRDDPSELPVFTASNEAKTNCLIKPRGENIFAAMLWFIDEKLKKQKSTEVSKLREQLKQFASNHNYDLEQKTAKMKAREKKVVTRSFHGAGLVVPVDEQDVGYRELPESDADLKKIFKHIADAPTEQLRNEAFDPLMEIVMLVQFANDECDYGEGLELGIDMFATGYKELHNNVLSTLPLAYQLLNRQAFADIANAHLKDRSHTAQLSQLK